MSGARVLIVEDELTIRRALEITLAADGYQVLCAADGPTAIELAETHRPDLVLLDLGLPARGDRHVDGMEVIEVLRRWSEVPIVVLSARDAETEKVAALDLGADDYVTKPFGIDEVLARVRAALRRAPDGEEMPVVEVADLCIDLANKRVVRAGAEVHLTPTEWRLLEHLVRHRGQLVDQTDLLRAVWGPQYGEETNYLRVFVAQLRKKLEPDPSRPRMIITEPGLGHRFEVPSEWDRYS